MTNGSIGYPNYIYHSEIQEIGQLVRRDDLDRVSNTLRCLKRVLSNLASIAVVLALSGCANPYALKIQAINYDQKQAPGIIQFTDPKIYKREALINERREEIAYLKKLLKDVKDEMFKAQIVREIELIQSFAGSLGLEHDARAGLNYQRTREISDIQHEIELTRVEMQLAQLKRDAELLRANLVNQREPSQSEYGDDVNPNNLPAPPNDLSFNQILEQIDELRNSVEDRIDSKSSQPPMSTGVSSPIETFHDKQAYRDAIKAAINAQSLDELHDMSGNSLFRIQLQATVLPSLKTHLDSLGMLRMEVTPPVMSESNRELPKLYQRWLWHVMQSLNRLPHDVTPISTMRFEQDQLLLGLAEIPGLFKVVMFEFSKSDSDSSKFCQGWREDERDFKNCWYLRIPLSPNEYETARYLYDLASQFPGSAIDDIKDATEDWTSADNNEGSCPDQTKDNKAIFLAQTVQATWPTLEQSLLHIANTDLGNPALTTHLRSEITKVISNGSELRTAASELMRKIADSQEGDCHEWFVAQWQADVPQAFVETINSILTEPGEPGNRVSVYAVSPTERAQRISTAARAADAIAMASSLIGSLPSAGLSGSGNFSFTRSAVGKADALERAPLVVGFAEPGVRSVKWVDSGRDDGSQYDINSPRHPSFGWLLGPKVSLNPKKRQLELEHYLAPYELHVDLSMPGWWPYVDLKVYSAWAPNWRTSTTTAKSFAPAKPRLERIVRIPLRHNAADMQGLTQLLLEGTTGRPVDQPRISKVHPHSLTVCNGSVTFAIEGDGIWRASEVHIGGYHVSQTGIRVLPDMTGIAVTIDSNDLPTLKNLGKEVVVWTHNGKASQKVDFMFTRDSNACADPPNAPLSKRPVIMQVFPSSISACDTDLTFIVEGRNLWSEDGKTTVLLGTMQASIQPKGSDDGTIVEVRSRISDRIRKTSGLNKLPVVIRTTHGVSQSEVTIATSEVCNKIVR